jgi:hypothetical protein
MNTPTSNPPTPDPARDPLDRALAQLPREVTPPRDLWQSIQAHIEVAPVVKPERRSFTRWYQMAAAVLLVIASSLTTFVLMRGERSEQPMIASEVPVKPALTAMPASFAGHGLGQGYAQARAALDKDFAARLSQLPAPTREKVERNLAQIRGAAHEIAETLAQHPNDPLLQELLLSTYQSELRLLTDVSRMTPAAATRVDL